MTPEPVTSPEEDFGRRAQSVYDLELTLVKFLTRLFIDTYRLDNPTLNLAQATQPTPPVVTGPDDVVSYDPTSRSQTLMLKVPPRVVRGRVPRTVTGEIAVDKLPDCPAIIVQVVSAKVQNNETLATLRICVSAYDENPDGSGYQDVQNMVEAISIALTSFGQQGIDQAYPIVMPFEWKLNENDTFPHYIAEITSEWELPSGRPLPDSEIFGIVPAEHIELRGSYPGAQYPPPPPPYEPPPVPTGPVLVDSWPIENQDRSDGYKVNMATERVGQQVTGVGKLYSVKFALNRRGLPAGDLIARLYAFTNRPDVALVESEPIPTSNIPENADPLATVLVEFLFTGANQFEMVAGDAYVIAATRQVDDTGWDNSLNQILMGETIDGGHPGKTWYYQGSWIPDFQYDKIFYLYTT